MTTLYKQPKSFEVQMALSVRSSDIDSTGLISYITYQRWLEELRLEILKPVWLCDRHITSNCIPILKSTQIEYKQPLQKAHKLTGKIWLAELGRMHWKLQTEIHCALRLIATATQTGFQMNCTTMRPVPISEDLFQDYWEHQWRL